jgi:hypothetical protein
MLSMHTALTEAVFPTEIWAANVAMLNAFVAGIIATFLVWQRISGVALGVAPFRASPALQTAFPDILAGNQLLRAFRHGVVGAPRAPQVAVFR